MPTVRRSTIVDAPIEAVWDVLRDFNGHDRWHPAVARSRLEGARSTFTPGCVRNFVLTSGERLRERLLSLSDAEHHFRYAIVESEVPLIDYVAEVGLRPVTDGDRTFWTWSSRFATPPGQEATLSELVAREVYEAGFEAVRRLVEGRRSSATQGGTPRRGVASVTPAGPALEGEGITLARHGGAEELRLAPHFAPAPGPGEVRLRQTAIGVNFIDIYCRTGYFDLLQPPATPGVEAVGEVVDVGSGVTHVAAGQRVGYACLPVGAYASVRTLPAALVVPLPDSLDDVTVAGGLLKGMTAEFLVHRVHEVKRGDNVLVFAPAGGVGRLLCQWASHLGANVIGATRSDAKAREARANGAHHVVLPGREGLASQVRALTDGRGADVIYDAVGRDSFAHSVEALAPCGHLVSYGQASGDIGMVDIGSLASRSVTLSRPSFGHYTDTPAKVADITKRLFDAIDRRILRIDVNLRLPLAEAAAAHRAIENGETTGSTVLLP